MCSLTIIGWKNGGSGWSITIKGIHSTNKLKHIFFTFFTNLKIELSVTSGQLEACNWWGVEWTGWQNAYVESEIEEGARETLGEEKEGRGLRWLSWLRLGGGENGIGGGAVIDGIDDNVWNRY